jgi:hypothetical protein
VKAIEFIAKQNYPAEKEANIVKALGLTPANFYRMRASDGNYPTLDQCAEICLQYNISASWLLTGKGNLKAIIVKQSPIELLKNAVQQIEIELNNKQKNKNGKSILKVKQKSQTIR